jgi:hypothetical protein
MRVLQLELGSGGASRAEQMLLSLVHRALAVDAEDRYSSPGEFLRELEQLLVQKGNGEEAAELCRAMCKRFSEGRKEASGLRGARSSRPCELMDIEDALDHDMVTARPDPVEFAMLLEESGAGSAEEPRRLHHWGLSAGVVAFGLLAMAWLFIW